MKDLLIMAVIGGLLYVFYKLMLKEPILPWKEKTVKANIPIRKKTKKNDQNEENEPMLFEDLFSDVKDVANHMIRFQDDSFALIAEVEPVNYFLKVKKNKKRSIGYSKHGSHQSHTRSNSIFKTVISTFRPIEQMVENMKNAEDLNEAALDYGYEMIKNLQEWQRELRAMKPSDT